MKIKVKRSSEIEEILHHVIKKRKVVAKSK